MGICHIAIGAIKPHAHAMDVSAAWLEECRPVQTAIHAINKRTAACTSVFLRPSGIFHVTTV
uniref:Uncharacterized protein n=1 Tax=Tetraselmis sp. GSL018 TaxID=582737 RepID=A0A061SFT2_9CHLO